MIFTAIGRMRLVAFAEGISLILLIFVAMPLKYAFKIPQPVAYIGLIHGILFVLYVFLLIQISMEKSLKIKAFLLAFVASFVPFGTFYVDRVIFSKVK